MSASAQRLAPVASASKQLGIRCFERGEFDSALRHFDDAAHVDSGDAEVHNYRSRALDCLERYAEALQATERALALQPANPIDMKNRGVLLRKTGRMAEALVSFERALTIVPDDVDVQLQRIRTLCDTERRDDALACADRLVGLQPNNINALNMRGMALERLQRYEEALADFDRMLALSPEHPDAINNRGMIYARRGAWRDALAAYDHSLSLQPEQPQAIYNRSIVRLALGDWELGLREFETRWNVPPLKGTRRSAAPRWDGSDSLAGKTIFVYHEQGYGDTLQCSRYVPGLIALGSRVVLAVPPPLTELMRRLHPQLEVISKESAIPRHDFQSPLMSLLLAFHVAPDKIVGEVPYLRAAPAAVRSWQARLGPRRRLRVGLVWSGRQYPPVNYPRDIPLHVLKPILDADAEFISLQKECSVSDREFLGSCKNLQLKHGQGLTDFADTAALIEALDLVICVDTAVAHLAGALGKPTWLLNRYASCWRWLQSGSTTAWYPTMRIFRQSAPGEWNSAISEAASAIQHRIALHPARKSLPHLVSETSTPALRPETATSTTSRPTIRFVCATRGTAKEFFASAPLGRSLPLYRTFPRGQRIELRLFKENTAGLSSVYNAAIEESRSDPAVLVFIHDDVYLSDYHWADRLLEALDRFDLVGLVGNRRRLPRQASWMYLDDTFKRDTDENLSGVIGHGDGFPALKELSIYGEPGQSVRLLDGVLMAARTTTLIENDLRFDPRFAFHFYDMDFCRQAELRSVSMGTWPISAIHGSAGCLGSPLWREAYRQYLEKYGET